MLMAETKPVHVPLEATDWHVEGGWRRLENLCEGVFDCPHTTPLVTESGPYVVRSQDIRSGIFRVYEAGHVSEATYRERIGRAEPRFGDLLYSREGTYFGIAAEVPPSVMVCLGQRMVLIRPDRSRISPRFLRYWLNSPTMARHVEGFRDGSVAER
jgi:type I restriction enzyme S subunit